MNIQLGATLRIPFRVVQGAEWDASWLALDGAAPKAVSREGRSEAPAGSRTRRLGVGLLDRREEKHFAVRRCRLVGEAVANRDLTEACHLQHEMHFVRQVERSVLLILL